MSYAGEVRFPGESFDLSSVVEALADALRHERPKALTATADGVSFRGGVLRPVLNTNLLVPITRGRIEVASEDSTLVVRYELKFTEIVILSTLLVAWMAVLISRTHGALLAALAFVGLWTFMVGGNRALARSRFQSLVKRSIRKFTPKANGS